uniref:Uncharacterized protein n=1 Tax=Kalanchoe fedtschenkoi TaxID=63787 RepID=A0A7N0VD54_KALFE
MFTDGLDESALNWVKQGSEEKKPQSPPSDKVTYSSLPRSPLSGHMSNLLSPHVLPPLKFHSSLLTPRGIVSPLNVPHDDYENVECAGSTASVTDGTDESYSEEYSGSDTLKITDEVNSDSNMVGGENMSGGGHSSLESRHCTSINRGLLQENLRIQVPHSMKRCAEGQLTGYSQMECTPGSNVHPHQQIHPSIKYVTPTGIRVNNTMDLGTPSAPPILEVEEEEIESIIKSKQERQSWKEEDTNPTACGTSIINEMEALNAAEEFPADWRSLSGKNSDIDYRELVTGPDQNAPQSTSFWPTNALDHSPSYATSGQVAWQTLIAYDACIRLCLYEWARGCTEAPEFLRDECLVLRNAFGLHKFLLQPRSIRPTESVTSKNNEQRVPPKIKKIVGKLRVEVRKIRIIPRRKLKSTYSQRGLMYVQAGADYVKQVSSLVKNGFHSLRRNSFSETSEDQVSCHFQLRSSLEDTKEQGSIVCLHAGTSDYHIFYPESQGDALLVEVQDSKKNVQGRATVSISALTDNPNERVRWWPLFHDDHECVGKIQLSIGNTMTSDDSNPIKSGPVVETLAYDLLLEAALRAQQFHSRNLRLHGCWSWLLTEFADYYGVSDSYAKLRYLTHVMGVATPIKDCLELVHELLVPVIKARGDKSLTRQEKSIFLDCETQVESLLAKVFENYKSLDENSSTGLTDMVCPPPESAAPALAPAVRIFTLLHDILVEDAQTMLRNYLQTAARKRCRMHMAETDEFVSSNSEGFLPDPITVSTAYSRMKNLCITFSNEIKADIKIHNEHILPSSIDLSNIVAAVYSTELCSRVKCFLAALPPCNPTSYVNELLIATSDFERDLESWNISSIHGGLNSLNLFHDYIMLWVQDMQLSLLDLCKAEKVPWSGANTNHLTSSFAENMYEKIKGNLVEYEVVMNRWPQYSLVLEKAVAHVERAIIKAMEKQYNDILTPLKDSIPKRLNVQVQKLTRRQSTAIYFVPSQLGIFLNTIKRIVDVLHFRVEDILKSWASYLHLNGDKKSYGEQMNEITVLLRTKYKNYMQAIVGKLMTNLQANRNTRLKRILEETREEDGESEVRERMQMLTSQLIECISNLHEVFASRIFIAICRGFWDKMGQTVLNFLEGRKENRVWYKGSYYALGILDDTFASQMQRLQGNALQEKDLEPPRSVVEARSILCSDTSNAIDPYFNF